MGRRITRKQLKQDEFVSAFDSVMQWLSGYWRPLVAGLGAVAVLLVLWGLASLWASSRGDEAAAALHEAIAAYEGDSQGFPGQAGGDVDAAAARFQEVVDRWGRSDQADAARLYLARIAVEQGDTEKARELLVRLADGKGTVASLATLELVRLRVAAGQAAEVIPELEAMVQSSDPILPRDMVLRELAEVCVAEQQPDKAREYLERLVDEFPDSPFQQEARQKLEELG
jgi:predicted negative regulator of RcsB-dependent stress response